MATAEILTMSAEDMTSYVEEERAFFKSEVYYKVGENLPGLDDFYELYPKTYNAAVLHACEENPDADTYTIAHEVIPILLIVQQSIEENLDAY